MSRETRTKDKVDISRGITRVKGFDRKEEKRNNKII